MDEPVRVVKKLRLMMVILQPSLLPSLFPISRLQLLVRKPNNILCQNRNTALEPHKHFLLSLQTDYINKTILHISLVVEALFNAHIIPLQPQSPDLPSYTISSLQRAEDPSTTLETFSCTGEQQGSEAAFLEFIPKMTQILSKCADCLKVG